MHAAKTIALAAMTLGVSMADNDPNPTLQPGFEDPAGPHPGSGPHAPISRASEYHSDYKRVSDAFRNLHFPIGGDAAGDGELVDEMSHLESVASNVDEKYRGKLEIAHGYPTNNHGSHNNQDVTMYVEVVNLPADGVVGCEPLESFYTNAPVKTNHEDRVLELDAENAEAQKYFNLANYGTGFDPYEVLGVPRGADGEAISLAFRRLAKQWHPDRWVNAPDAERLEAETRFKQLNLAQGVLADKAKRKKYDEGTASVADLMIGFWEKLTQKRSRRKRSTIAAKTRIDASAASLCEDSRREDQFADSGANVK